MIAKVAGSMLMRKRSENNSAFRPKGDDGEPGGIDVSAHFHFTKGEAA